MPNLTHHYVNPTDYESKLQRVIGRLGAKLLDYEWTGRVRAKRGEVPNDQRPQVATIEFSRVDASGQVQLYLLRHTPANSARGSVPVTSGIDLFCQLVLALEMVAKLGEWGFSQLTVEAALSAAKELVPAALPEWCGTLGLDALPTAEADVHQAYRRRMREVHPDAGGDRDAYERVQVAYQRGLAYIAGRGGHTLS